jgi:hypothetical protein
VVGALALCLFLQCIDLICELRPFTLALSIHALNLLAQHLNFDL